MSRSKSSSSEFDFPTDLLIEILKRLPLKSLIRLTLVCKSWFYLLTSPVFNSALASHNFITTYNGNPIQHLFKDPIDVSTNSLPLKFSLFNSDAMIKDRSIDCPVGQNHFVVSSHNGLICLFNFHYGNPKTAPLILWNPSIRMRVAVPVPVDRDVAHTQGGFPQLIFGLGFDSLSSDYKLVRVAYFNGADYGGGTRLQGDVYGLGSGKWRSLGPASVSHNFATIRWRGVYLNGVIHWLSNVNVSLADDDDDNNRRPRHSVLTFKLGNEEFGEISLPKVLADAGPQTVKVMTVPKCSKEVLGVVHNVGSALSIWVMEEYSVKDSWVMLFSFDVRDTVKHDLNVVVLSEEFAMVQTRTDHWISYNDKNKETTNLGLIGTVVYVDPYVESLVLFRHLKRDGALPIKEVQRDGRSRRRSSRYRNRKGKANAK